MKAWGPFNKCGALQEISEDYERFFFVLSLFSLMELILFLSGTEQFIEKFHISILRGP